MSDGIVIVTGAASGIGLAVAERLASSGWAVAMLDRDADLLNSSASRVAGATSHPIDVTDETAVVRTIAEIAADRRIVGLVNSAGIAANVLLADTTVELFRRILDVNVIGSFLMAREAAALMRESGGGSIVHIASVSGMQGNVGRTAYGASKGAVITMTKVMAVELAAAGIRVNAVAPGPVETPMVQAHHSAAERESWHRHLPMRRYATPDEIAAGVVYLIDGRQSAYVTGHILAIDGGFVAGGTTANP